MVPVKTWVMADESLQDNGDKKKINWTLNDHDEIASEGVMVGREPKRRTCGMVV